MNLMDPLTEKNTSKLVKSIQYKYYEEYDTIDIFNEYDEGWHGLIK